MPAPRPGRMYPVISFSIDDAENQSREQGRGFALHRHGVEALESAGSHRKGKAPSPAVVIWAREDVGLDRFNRPAQIVFLFVVTVRGGTRLSTKLCEELNLRWGPVCRVEGNYAPVGDETPFWRLDPGGGAHDCRR